MFDTFTLSPDNFTRLSSSTRCTIFTRLPISQCPLFLPFSLGLRGLLVSHGGAHLLSNVSEGPRPHSGRFVAWFSSLPPFCCLLSSTGLPSLTIASCIPHYQFTRKVIENQSMCLILLPRKTFVLLLVPCMHVYMYIHIHV